MNGWTFVSSSCLTSTKNSSRFPGHEAPGTVPSVFPSSSLSFPPPSTAPSPPPSPDPDPSRSTSPLSLFFSSYIPPYISILIFFFCRGWVARGLFLVSNLVTDVKQAYFSFSSRTYCNLNICQRSAVPRHTQSSYIYLLYLLFKTELFGNTTS
jgi:hypothetical protein